MKVNIFYSAVLLIFLTADFGYTQNIFVPTSPCQQYFQYVSDSEGNYYGTIEVPSSGEENVTMAVNMTYPYSSNSYYYGPLGLNWNADDTEQYRRAREHEPLLYRVDFPVHNPLPKLKYIYYNGDRICVGESDDGEVEIRSIYHESHFPMLGKIPRRDELIIEYTPRPAKPARGRPVTQPPFSPRPVTQSPFSPSPVTRPPFFSRPVTQRPPNSYAIPENTIAWNPRNPQSAGAPVNALRSQDTEEVCGHVDSKYSIRQLVVLGVEVDRGSWPWTVALYKTKIGSMNYQCAGSLINAQTVLTAAHCFLSLGKLLQTNEITIALGRNNIQEPEDNGVMAAISQFEIHEQYLNPRSADADIALAILANRVIFTDYIRPICLWSGPDNVVNQIGQVVGWGLDENNKLSATPRRVSAIIADNAECLLTHEAFRTMVSNRTFCAGNRDGSGPCKGDSGTGLMIKRGKQWMIRGIVSTAIFRDEGTCNLDEYVAYSDVSKFMFWIKRTVRKFVEL